MILNQSKGITSSKPLQIKPSDVDAAVEASVTGVVRAEAVDNNTCPRRATPRPLYAELEMFQWTCPQ